MSLAFDSTTDLRSVADLVERETGVRPSQELVGRWAQFGCGGVLLPAALIYGEWQTTERAFAAFVKAASLAADEDLIADAHQTLVIEPLIPPWHPEVTW